VKEHLTLSPTALAAISKPAGVKSFPVIDRNQWLALRKRDVTASVAAALFGDIHPYQTAYGLWALKSGLVTEDHTENPAMRRGRLLEPIALQMLAEDFSSWKIEPAGVYYSDPDARIGATPDAFAIQPDTKGFGIVQVKTAGKFAFKKGWKSSEGDIDTPLWVAVQASVEAALTGASWAVVAVLELGDGGLDLHVEDIPLRPALMVKLRELAKDFWRRVDEKDAYAPDYGRDAAILAKIYAEAEDAEIDLSGNNRIPQIIAEREALKSREKDGDDAVKARKVLDAELIHVLGNCERGRLADGRIVTAKTTRRGAYEVKATSYRQIKIKEPKQGRAAE
jgi:predicted phage-related endonuclease